MSMTINRESFVVTAVKPRHYGDGTYEEGTIEVSFAGKTVRAAAKRFGDGDVFINGFVGRYVTSAKPWRAIVAFRNNTSEKPYVNFGRDDRSGRFNKANMVQYAPDIYEKA